MSQLELVVQVTRNHDVWRDGQGTHWFCVWIGPDAWDWVTHRVGTAEAERRMCSGAGWMAEVVAEVRGRCDGVDVAVRRAWPDARYGRSMLPGPDVGDRMARLAFEGPPAEERPLLAATSRSEPGARAVYADWLRGRGREREAEALAFSTLAIGQATRPAYYVPRRWQLRRNAWPMTFSGPGYRWGSLQLQPREGGPIQWVWTDGIPSELVIAPPRGEVGPESALAAVLEALEDELAIAPWMRALRVIWPPPPSWPWGLDALLRRLAGQAWIERLALVVAPDMQARFDLTLLAELPGLRSLTVVGPPRQLELSALLGQLGGLRELRAPHWSPSPDDLARLEALRVERLQVNRAPAAALAKLGLRELKLSWPNGDLGALGDQLTSLELGFGGEWWDPEAESFTQLRGLRSLGLWGLADISLTLPDRLQRLVLRDSSVRPRGEVEELHVDAIDVAVDHLERSLTGVTRLALGARRVPVRLATPRGREPTALERLPPGLQRLSLTGCYLHSAAARSLRRYEELKMLELVDSRSDAHVASHLPALAHVALWGSPDVPGLRALAEDLEQVQPDLMLTAAYEA